MSDSQSLYLDSATSTDFDGVPDSIDPAGIAPPVVTKTLNNTLYQPVNFFATKSSFGSPFTIGAAGAITVAGYNAITSFLTTAATVITDGKILATDVGTTHGNGIVLLTDGGLVVNQAQGEITGGYLGIYTKDFATITNAGIDNAGGFGIFMRSGGDVSNSGQITVPTANNRQVTTYNQTGIDLHGAGTITNLAGGKVSGVDAAGIKYGVGKIVNNGLLQGSLLGAYLGNGGVVLNSGTITANAVGGNIGFNNAVVLYRGGTLINTGYIYGENARGYGVAFGGAATTITNSGTIRAGDEAIQAYGSALITNTRLIEGNQFGIAFEANAADTLAHIVNTGTITGGTAGIQLFTSGLVSNGTLSVIEGGADGILFEGTTFAETATISNSGVIESGQGAAGIAIDFGTAVASLTLGASGTLIGQVIADGAAGNRLDLTGTRTAVLAGIGTEITGFTTIQFAGGATAAIEGDVAGLADGQTILGFKTADEIILDGFSLSSAGYVSKKGFELFSGATEVELGTTGKLQGDFLLRAAGGATTLSAVGAINTLGTGDVEIMLNGGKQSHEAVDAGGVLEVFAGGKASAAVINSAGLLEVYSGGSASGSVIQAGGREIIRAGGVASATTLAGGTLEFTKGAKLLNGLHLGNGGGTLQLDGGAVVPGTFAVGASSSDVLLLTGKSSAVLSGLGTTINGFEHITFAAGAAWHLEGNITGIANGESFAGFAAGDALTMQGFGGLSGTYADGDLALFNNGATESVSLGLAGGVDLLVHGPSASSTITGIAGTAALTLGVDAFEIVTSGAVADHAVVNSGGAQIVVAGGTASGTILKHGSLTVSAGGAADGVTISAGGSEVLRGTATGLTVSSGGAATLASGGTLTGGTIAGGELDILAGGTLGGPLAFTGTGGDLVLSSPPPGNVISGFLKTDTIDVDGFSATSHSFISGVGLELFNGAQTITLDLAGDFSNKLFKVKAGAGGTVISLSANPPAAPHAATAIPLTTPRMTMLAPSHASGPAAIFRDFTPALGAACLCYANAQHAMAVTQAISPNGWVTASLVTPAAATPPAITLQP
jgi:autotransporter passenger strand-loop-strand repeat protein